MEAAPLISVLLVDDDPTYCEFMALSLSDYGFRVLIANCGASALELADQADIALVDMIMPGLSGVETIPLIRCSNSEIAVIACSGCEEQRFRDDLDRLEVEKFLGKPIPLSVLVQEIDLALAAKAA